MKPTLSIIYILLLILTTSCSSINSKQRMKVITKVDSASVDGLHFNIQGLIVNNTKNTIIINSKSYSCRYKMTGAVISDSSGNEKPIIIAFSRAKAGSRRTTDKLHRLKPKESIPFTCKIPVSIEYNNIQISWQYKKLNDSEYYRTDRVIIKY